MATNVTTDHIKYMERHLKDKKIHLEKAYQRIENYNTKKLPAKKANPKNKNWQNKEPIDPETLPEIINLKREIEHYEFAIQAMKEKQKRDEKQRILFPRKEIFRAKEKK